MIQLGIFPDFTVITEGKTHEVTIAKKFHFALGTILVLDKGYGRYDYIAASLSLLLHLFCPHFPRHAIQGLFLGRNPASTFCAVLALSMT